MYNFYFKLNITSKILIFNNCGYSLYITAKENPAHLQGDFLQYSCSGVPQTIPNSKIDLPVATGNDNLCSALNYRFSLLSQCMAIDCSFSQAELSLHQAQRESLRTDIESVRKQNQYWCFITKSAIWSNGKT